MEIRPVKESDRSAWIRMRYALWPQAEPPHEEEIDRFFRGESREPEAVIVAELHGELKGFTELSIRAQASGCVSDHIGYIEGWYVDPDARGKGIGRALIRAGEVWARSHGCSEFASDTDLDNEYSAGLHRLLGFEEVGQIRCFRKSL